jgi:hypothetical protein
VWINRKKRNYEKDDDSSVPAIPDYFDNDVDASDSDVSSNDGLPASKVLSQKHFGTAVIGGARKMIPEPPTLQLQEGQKVLARFQKQSDWFPGTIVKVEKSITATE